MSGEFMWWLKTPIGIDVLSKATATVRSHGKIFWPGIRDVSDFKLWQLLLQSSPSSPFPPPWYFLKNTTVGPGITLAACLGGKPCCLMCPWWQRVMYYGILYHHDMLLPAIQTCARTTGMLFRDGKEFFPSHKPGQGRIIKWGADVLQNRNTYCGARGSHYSWLQAWYHDSQHAKKAVCAAESIESKAPKAPGEAPLRRSVVFVGPGVKVVFIEAMHEAKHKKNVTNVGGAIWVQSLVSSSENQKWDASYDAVLRREQTPRWGAPRSETTTRGMPSKKAG